MRANDIAAAHMAQGSNVTYRSQSVSLSLPSAAVAARMATSSAWAVGSRSATVRLPARAITVSPRTIAQPTGTSPRASAARASSRAMAINEGRAIVSPSCPALCRASTSLYTFRQEGVDGRDKRGHDEEFAHVRQEPLTNPRRTDRQSDRARGARLPARGGNLDHGRSRFRQRSRHFVARTQRETVRSHHGRWHAVAAARTHAAFPLSQAGRTDDDPFRPGGTRYDFPYAPEGPAAADQRRPARYQHGRTAVAHQ